MLNAVLPKRVWNTVLFLLPIILLESFMIGLSIGSVQAGTNQKIHVSTVCGRKRQNRLHKVVDGAVLISEREHNLDCAITFQTDSALQKFMLRFDKLSLDCNDHLYIYEGENTHTKHQFDLSCRSNRLAFKVYFTKANHVTLKYKTHAFSQRGNGFVLVITAFKSLAATNCREFRCENKLCIDKELTCDGYNHCNDNSDETHFAYCQADNSVGRILGLGVGIFIAVVVGVFVICFVFIISITMCICKNRALGRRRPPPPPPLTPACSNSAPTTNMTTATAAANNQQGLQHFSSWIHPCYRPWDEKSSSSISIGKITTTTATPSSATSTPTSAPTLPARLVSPGGTSARDRLQRPSTKPLLSNKASSNSQVVKTFSDLPPSEPINNTIITGLQHRSSTLPPPQKGEWLV